MSRHAWILVAAVALGAITAAGAGTASSTADDIVARYVKARGGLKKIRAIESLRQTGSVSTGANRRALAVREIKRPARSRFEFTLQGVTGVYVTDGQRGWQVSPFDGDMSPTALPDEVVSDAAEQADFEGPLVDWKAKGHRVEIAGREVVDGREAYRLKLTLQSGAVRHEYIDVASSRLVRTDSTRVVRGRPVQIQTTFHDFRKSAGVAFPRRIEVQAAGRPQRLSVVVDKVEVNPPLDDARFKMPAGAAEE